MTNLNSGARLGSPLPALRFLFENVIESEKHFNKAVDMLRKDYCDITEKNVPRWYAIVWEKNRLLLKIGTEVFDHFENFFARIPETPIVLELRETLETNGYKSGDFSFDPRVSLGFGNQIKFLEEQDGFFTYLVPLPKLDSETFQISASLASITHLLQLFNMEAKTYCESAQQLTFITGISIGLYGSPILGKISIPLRIFLDRMGREQNEKLKVSVELAMVKAWRMMHGKVSFCEKNRLSFKLRENGFFHLDCPGNACGLDPCDYPDSLNEGYDFCPHNTDAPKQQLTLLAGLAAICTLAKKG